jgi:predicted CoA-binding protein
MDRPALIASPHLPDARPCTNSWRRCCHLAALKDEVDGVLVTVPPAKGMEVLREAAQEGRRNVWIQQQGDSPEELALARQLGLNVVSGKCILMYATPVRSFHKWHRGFNKLVGKL